MRIRILLADDHDVVRRGIRALLETHPGWEVCAEACNGREAIEQTKKLKPDVVLLDVSMPLLNGLEAARHIRKESPRTEILMLTMHDSEELAREVLEIGARGYLLKSDADREIISAVEALSHHKPFFTTKISQMVLQGYLKPGETARKSKPARSILTARETEIVQLLAEGKSNKEVADTLQISVKTVETHRANIMRKLNLASFSELVRYAIRHHIIEA
ncbi:MAG: response regulator transcription factor [Acidobacteria bacterium]|nr:response regulator transcription factor [Acidobacteriota bacterium]MCL5288846.1 response regulator transcription factor [Acidobacteriota bacterium]